jgi:hypothetical protein
MFIQNFSVKRRINKMNGVTVVTAAGFATLLLQGLKWLWRKIVVKDMLYEFPAWFYLITVPGLNIAVVPVLAFFGFQGFALPTDWMAWGQNIGQVFVGALISTFVYNDVVAPFNVYRMTLKAKRAKKALTNAK